MWSVGVVLTVAVASAGLSLYYARLSRYEASLRASSAAVLTTDQELAALSTNVTLLGVMVGAAAIAIGVVTLFGYAELRTSTFRKTEDDIVKIIRKLSDDGSLPSVTAAALIQEIAPDRVFNPSMMGRQIVESGVVPAASEGTGVGTSENEKIAQSYPKDTN